MSKRSRSFRKRKGLSEMVGAVFIIALIGASAAFALAMFSSFTSYQNAVNQRAQYNSQVPREQLAYNKVTFGGSQAYSPSGNFPSGSLSSATPAVNYPISNMNFSGSANGWTFTRIYLQTGVYGESGNYDPITSEGSSSGPGSIFTDFTFNQGSSNTVEAIGNWTAQFTLTPSQISSLNLSSGTDTFQFRIGDNLPALYNVHAASGSPVVTAYLVNAKLPNAQVPGSYIIVGAPTPPSNGVWTLNSYSLTKNQLKTFFACNWKTNPPYTSCAATQGVYNLILKTDITLKGQSAAASEQRVYFDDTGIRITFQDFNQVTVCPTFQITQPALSIQDLTISLTTSYTTSATQTVYFWDFAQGALTQVDLTTIGNTATTRYLDLGGLVGGASQVQRFIQQSPGTHLIAVPGCPNTISPPQSNPISTTPGTVIMQITATGQGSFSGTFSAAALTAFYSTSGQFSVQILNDGSETIHFVSFWVIGSTGATQFASTLGGGTYFEEWVAPGQSVTFTVSYPWSPGQYHIQLVSARGNIFTDTVTAS